MISATSSCLHSTSSVDVPQTQMHPLATHVSRFSGPHASEAPVPSSENSLSSLCPVLRQSTSEHCASSIRFRYHDTFTHSRCEFSDAQNDRLPLSEQRQVIQLEDQFARLSTAMDTNSTAQLTTGALGNRCENVLLSIYLYLSLYLFMYLSVCLRARYLPICLLCIYL